MATNSTDDTAVEHKFVVVLDKIKLIVEEPIECSIKYEYDLFCSYEVWTKPFPVNEGHSDFQEIPLNHRRENQFSTSNSKLKEYLDSNPLQVEVFNKDTLLGIATIKLGKLYSPDADKMWFGLRYMAEAPICDLETKEIGNIKMLIILETEDSIKCKYCNDYFKATAIRKHAIHNKKCNICYTDEDLKSLQDMAKERQRKRRSQRHQDTYNSEERVKKYKDSKKEHDPVKRRAKYEKEIVKAKEEEIKLRKSKEESVLNGYKKSGESVARQINQEKFQLMKRYFREDWQRIEGNVAFPIETKEKIKEIDLKMENLYKDIEKEIDAVVKDIKDLKSTEEAGAFFKKLKLELCYKKDLEEAENDFKNDKKPQKNRIKYQWLEQTLENNAELKKIAKKEGRNPETLGKTKEEVKPMMCQSFFDHPWLVRHYTMVINTQETIQGNTVGQKI